MRVLQIDHVQLAMPAGGESVAVAFYEVVLGILNRDPFGNRVEFMQTAAAVGD